MRVVADNDVIGAVAALRRLLESSEWLEYADDAGIEFIDFASLGLVPASKDPEVWQVCQEADVVLITGNRASGEGSLDDTIRDQGQPDSLPVMTIGDPRRVVEDREYAVACVTRLLDFVDRIDTLRGVGRLFLP